MARKCAVCGKEVGFFSSEIVKGQSGEEVCKECLKKAGISSIRFGCERIYSNEIRQFIEEGKPIKRKAPSGCLIAFLVPILIFIFFLIIIIATDESSTNNTIEYNNDNRVEITNDEIHKETDVKFVSAISINDAYITESIINTNELNISVSNNSEYTIDAFDYTVEAYNSYGEKISSFLNDSFTATDIQILPNSEYSSRATLYWADTATQFKVVITRYHIKDTNETVRIKSADRVWVSVKK